MIDLGHDQPLLNFDLRHGKSAALFRDSIDQRSRNHADPHNHRDHQHCYKAAQKPQLWRFGRILIFSIALIGTLL